jgi:hypothetical protein
LRLQTRLALLFGAVVIIAAAIIGSLSYLEAARQLGAQVDDSLLAVSEPIAQSLTPGEDDDDLLGERPRRRRGPDSEEIRTNLVLPTQIVLPTGSIVTSPDN